MINPIIHHIFQITTPHSVGSGFIWPNTTYVVTNAHVVDGHKEVVLNRGDRKLLAEVCFLDELYDLALAKVEGIETQKPWHLNEVDFLEAGQDVSAFGFADGDYLEELHGSIRNPRMVIDGKVFIEHDVHIKSGLSGGPLLDDEHRIIGVNCFVDANNQSLSYAIGVPVIQKVIKQLNGENGLRCPSCAHVVLEKQMEGEYCPICGSGLAAISTWPDYEPRGMQRTIESLLDDLGYDVRLARQGLYQWIVYRGSARIIISYHNKSGLIIAESELLELGENNIFEIYRYLLQQNANLRGLSFSMNGMKVILSTVIHDQYLEESSTKRLLKDLFEKSDEYDDVLMDMNR